MCNLYEQIQQACKKAGLTVSAMCLALGMSKSTMSDLKSGRTFWRSERDSNNLSFARKPFISNVFTNP